MLCLTELREGFYIQMCLCKGIHMSF